MSRRLRVGLLALMTWAVLRPVLVQAQTPESTLTFRKSDEAARAAAKRASSGPNSQAGNPNGQVVPALAMQPVDNTGRPTAEQDGVAPAGYSDSGYGQGYGPSTMSDDYDFADAPIGPSSCSGGGCNGGAWQNNMCFDNGWGCNWMGGPIGFRPRGQFYARAEYLAWWVKGDNLPPLVTTGTTGILGQTGTSVLFGDTAANSSMRSGVRGVIGYAVSPVERIEGEFFWLGTANTNFSQSSSGSPLLARPYTNLATGLPDAFIVANAGQPGSIQVHESSTFLGAGIQAMRNLCCTNSCNSCCDSQFRLDFLYGFRYLQLTDNLSINDSFTNAVAATTLTNFDGFKTSNNFYGFNFGLSSERRVARWSLLTTGRLGLGGTSQHVTISGNTTITPPGSTQSGGLLALPSNIGSYSRNVFGFVPQLETKVGYNVTPNLRFTVGYDIIYWSRVVRAGEQIGSPPQSTTTPSSGGPVFSFHETSLWVQGVSIGGDLRF
jgi:Putative beta barrel porin-7 (BBP7)